MSNICKLCGKRSKSGNKVSHSNKKTRRLWKPNIQKLLVDTGGENRRINICTSCIKSGKVKRPAKIKLQADSETK